MKKIIFALFVMFCVVNVHANPTVEYHANGNKKSEITENNGVQAVKLYDKEGKLIEQGELRNGKRHGKWESFDKDGKRNFVKHYLNGHIIAEGLGDLK